ncbi:MAG: 2-dehydro-3-deoxygalactonokinase [Sphingobium sp.]
MTGTHILGDWGTTRLRLFRMVEGVSVDRLEGPGIGSLPARPAVVLGERLTQWRGSGLIDGVTLCGMAGARGGLVEAAYVECPVGLDDWLGHQTRTLVDEIPVAVLPGLRCQNARQVPDVLRGEETQIFGALALDPALAKGSRTIVLPGTHSKWAQVEDGVVQGFRTCPTGELYALLSDRSTLVGKSVSGRGDEAQGFARGLLRSDEPLTSALFEARAGQLLEGRSRRWALGYLSGLLIGAEVAAQAQAGAEVVLIGDPTLCDRYALALAAKKCAVRTMDGDATVLAGLELARGRMA